MPTYRIKMDGDAHSGWAEGFKSLAEAMVPDPMKEAKIRAYAAGVDRDYAASAKSQQETADLRRFARNQKDLAALVGTPGWQDSPQLRTEIGSLLVGGGKQDDLGTLLGQSAALGMPGGDSFSDRDLARYVGAGGTNAGNTLYGFETTEARERRDDDLDHAATLRGQDMDYATALDKQGLIGDQEAAAYENEQVNAYVEGRGIVPMRRGEALRVGAPIIGKDATPEQIFQGGLDDAGQDALALGYGDDRVNIRRGDQVLSVPASEVEGYQAEGWSPVLSESDARGTAFMELDPSLAATAVGPTKSESEGATLESLPPGQREELLTRDSRSVKNYEVNGQTYLTRDGQTDAQTGEPLPPGGRLVSNTTTEDRSLSSSTRSQIEGQAMELSSTQDTINDLANIDDPKIFGPVGFLSKQVGDIQSDIDALGTLFGYENLASEVIDSVEPELAQKIFDTRRVRTRLDVLADMLAFQAAGALYGQSGRSLSDKDFDRVRAQINTRSVDTFQDSIALLQQSLDRKREELGRIYNNGPDALFGPQGNTPVAPPSGGARSGTAAGGVGWRVIDE